MPHITANGLELFYDEHGAADAPPMLLVMGLGAQMTLWPLEMVEVQFLGHQTDVLHRR